MRRYRTVIVIVLMGVVPMVAAVFVMRFILPSDQPEPIQALPPVQQAAPAPPPVVEEEPEEVMVLAAAQALPVGTLLADEHLTEAGIEDGFVGRWHIETGNLGYDEMPYGYVVRKAIPAGAPVTWSSLVGPRQRGFLAAVLKPGMRAITVRLGAGTRHSGLVDPGDRVDVVLTAQSRERGEQNVLARTILEDVRVVAVDRRIASAASSSDGGGEVERAEIATATLEVLPSQTGLLALGELEGELSLAVRPLAAAGTTPKSADVVDMRSLLALTQESLQQKTVRVVRGSAVSDVTFATEAQPSSSPKTVLADEGLETARLLEASRALEADRAGPSGLPEERIGRMKPLAVEMELEPAAELDVSLAVDTREGSGEPVAPDVEGLHALPTAGEDPGAQLVQHPAGGVGLPGRAPESSFLANTQDGQALLQGRQQRTVRMVLGSAVSGVIFAAEAQPFSPPKTDLADDSLEAARELETSRALEANRNATVWLSEERIGSTKPSVDEAELEPAAELDVSLVVDTRESSDEPLAPDVERLHALPATGVDPGAELVQRLAAGVGLPGGISKTVLLADTQGGQALLQDRPQQMTVRVVRGSAVSDVTFRADEQPASFPEDIPAEYDLAEGRDTQSPQALASDRPGPDSDTEERIDGSASPVGEMGPVPTAGTALALEADRQEGGEERETADTEAASSLSVADPEFSGELAQPLSSSVGVPDLADSEATARSAAGPPAASLPEDTWMESGQAAAPNREQPPVLAADRPRLDRAPDERFELGTAPIREAVPAPSARFAASPASPSSLSRDNRPEHELAAGLALKPMDAVTADRPGPAVVPQQNNVRQAVPAEKAASAPAVRQANALAFPSIPLQMLSENGTAIAGGGALLLGWAGAFAWLRRQDRPLRRRLQAVGAPLTGFSVAEKVAPEESIFRSTRPRSRLTWLWRRIERRYPLIDAPRAFPRLVGFGVLIAVVVWAAMWVMGMSGWWLTPAAALAGLFGARYALGQMQKRLEKQFIQRFPEVVDQIVRLSIAGLPPLEALTKVAEDAQPPVKGVLEEVSDALLAGLDPDTALGMVSGRVRLSEFTLFAAVIRLQRRAGGSISGAFSNLANTLRERQNTALKAKSATAQTRLTLLVLMLMPPLVFGVQSMTTPHMVDMLFNTEDGQLLLQLGVGLIVAGLILARTIAARGPK